VKKGQVEMTAYDIELGEERLRKDSLAYEASPRTWKARFGCGAT